MQSYVLGHAEHGCGVGIARFGAVVRLGHHLYDPKLKSEKGGSPHIPRKIWACSPRCGDPIAPQKFAGRYLCVEISPCKGRVPRGGAGQVFPWPPPCHPSNIQRCWGIKYTTWDPLVLVLQKGCYISLTPSTSQLSHAHGCDPLLKGIPLASTTQLNPCTIMCKGP